MLHGHNDLKVYRLAYQTAMTIFEESKGFPKEERYSLTDQIRRSSRSVAANIAESYRRRRYPAMFINRIVDADPEATKTKYGSTLRMTAAISQKKAAMYCLSPMKKLARCLVAYCRHPRSLWAAKALAAACILRAAYCPLPTIFLVGSKICRTSGEGQR